MKAEPNGKADERAVAAAATGTEGAPSPNGPDGSATPAPSGGRGDGRDDKGRFARGNRGGPGNPFARKVAALRSALINGLTDENMRAVKGKLLEMTLAGDLDAARLLLSYAAGPPPDKAPDPDRVDLDEFKLLREQPWADHPRDLSKRVGADVALALGRASLAAGEGLAVARGLGTITQAPHLARELTAAGLGELLEAAQRIKAILFDADTAGAGLGGPPTSEGQVAHGGTSEWVVGTSAAADS
jgi:hypothetical protein